MATPRENGSYVHCETGETPCPSSKDGTQHCNCWYDGDACCWCSASEMSERQRVDQGMVEGPVEDPDRP